MWDATYLFTCGRCGTETLAIRRRETTPLTSAYCPTCGERLLVHFSTRHESQGSLQAAAEALTKERA